MAKVGLSHVAILGGGPAGFEAALQAKQLGHTVTLFESGQPGEFLGRWGFVKMFTPFGMNASPLSKLTLLAEKPNFDLPADTEFLTGKEYRDRYLLPLAQSDFLKGCIRAQSSAVMIGRTAKSSFRILIREPNNVEKFETADVIFDCTGTYGKPNWVGDGGIPAAGEIASRGQIAYWLEDVRGAKKAHYAGKTTIVIGSGYSAATTVTELVELAKENPATWTIWLTNGPRSQPLPRIPNDPFKERDRLAAKANHLAARCDGNLEYHANTAIDELVSHGQDKGFRVVARLAGKPMTWDVDRVIANVGYKPETNLTGELRESEPGFFVIGAKAAGRGDSLIKDSFEQIKAALSSLAKLKAA